MFTKKISKIWDLHPESKNILIYLLSVLSSVYITRRSFSYRFKKTNTSYMTDAGNTLIFFKTTVFVVKRAMFLFLIPSYIL
jgi:hypothetical protein